MKTLKSILINWPLLFVIFAVGFNLFMLFPETQIKMDLNDNVFAYTLISRMNITLSDIFHLPFSIFHLPLLLDHWTPEWAMGYPVFSYYQHIPHLTVVLLYRILLLTSYFLPFTLSLMSTFNWFKYLMLSFFPLAIYYSGRKFDLSKLTSASSALISTFISTQYLYGTDYNSLVFRGSGMYTQLWGIFFLPLALSAVYQSLKYNKSYITAVVFLSLSLAGHLVFGYIAVLSTPLLYLIFIMNNLTIKQSQQSVFSALVNSGLTFGKRLLFILSSAFILLSYWLIPLILNSAYQNKSFWDDLTKFNSYGAMQIIKWLLNGQIFDNARWPVLTTMVAMGFFYALYSYFTSREKSLRVTTKTSFLFFPLLFLFWLVLYFGRYTFGSLFDLLPMSEGLHGHRLINGVHVAGIFLAGLSLEWFYKTLEPIRNQIIKFIIFITLITLILFPVIKERYDYLFYNTISIRNAMTAYSKDAGNFEKVIDTINKNGPARVNIGRPGNWGRNFNIGQSSSYFGLSVNNLDTIGFEPESWSPNTDIEQFFSEYAKNHYRLFNIDYIVAPPEEKFATETASFTKKIAQYGKFVVYKVTTPQGNFDFINSNLLIYTNKNFKFNLDRLWLDSELMKNKNHPSVTYKSYKLHNAYPYELTMLDLANYHFGSPDRQNPEQNIFSLNPFNTKELLSASASTPSGIILEEKKDNNYFSAKAETDKESVLMLKVTYHPFWKATVDQKPVEIFMVEPAFMAIRIPPGQHTVEFTYFPAWYKNVLLIVSLLTLPSLWFCLRRNIFVL